MTAANRAVIDANPLSWTGAERDHLRKGCRRFLCSQSKLQSGPTERPHPSIKSRLTTTQSRHPTELRHGNPSGLPSELSANRKVSRNGLLGSKKRIPSSLVNFVHEQALCAAGVPDLPAAREISRLTVGQREGIHFQVIGR